MEFEDALKNLHKSKEFKDWKKTHKNSFLTYAFIMISEEVKK